MTSIQEIIDAVYKLKEHSDPSVGMPLLVLKAIESKGIRDPNDLKRLSKAVREELRTRKAERKPVTPEEAATEFNDWLARKYARYSGMGRQRVILFTELPARVSDFMNERYASIDRTLLPQHGDVVVAIRSKWGEKATKTRDQKKQGKAKREREAQDRARQLPLF